MIVVMAVWVIVMSLLVSSVKSTGDSFGGVGLMGCGDWVLLGVVRVGVGFCGCQ